ncbi:MAG: pyruvate kinase, partial [Hydrogenoanaerobacterium sp.]
MRKTKIICTLGPATETKEKIKELILAGMNVARFNFSHGTHDEHLKKLEILRELREEMQLPIASLLDTKG